jgi:site-specific recombinase XerD
MNTLNEFEKHLKDQDRADLTVRGYLADVKRFVTWFTQTNGESFALESVTPSDIREYRQFLQVTEQRKAGTINRSLAAIQSLMSWAHASGRVASNPASGIKPVRQVPSAPQWLTKKEQYALERAIEKDLQLAQLRYPKRWRTRRRDASLVQFMFHTGMRLNEISTLRLGDIQLGERSGKVLIRQGKGNKERIVPLNSEARKAIQEWLAVRPEAESDFLWLAIEAETKKLSPRALQRIIKRYAEEAGLADLTPHVLRHTFAKNLADQGVGLEKIASLLGHSNLNTTRIYLMPGERDLEQAVRKLEK